MQAREDENRTTACHTQPLWACHLAPFRRKSSCDVARLALMWCTGLWRKPDASLVKHEGNAESIFVENNEKSFLMALVEESLLQQREYKRENNSMLSFLRCYCLYEPGQNKHQPHWINAVRPYQRETTRVSNAEIQIADTGLEES